MPPRVCGITVSVGVAFLPGASTKPTITSSCLAACPAGWLAPFPRQGSSPFRCPGRRLSRARGRTGGLVEARAAFACGPGSSLRSQSSCRSALAPCAACVRAFACCPLDKAAVPACAPPLVPVRSCSVRQCLRHRCGHRIVRRTGSNRSRCCRRSSHRSYPRRHSQLVHCPRSPRRGSGAGPAWRGVCAARAGVGRAARVCAACAAERPASAPVAPVCAESTAPVLADWLDAPDSQVATLSAVSAFCAGRAALSVFRDCVEVPAEPAGAVCDRVALDAPVLPVLFAPGGGCASRRRGLPGLFLRARRWSRLRPCPLARSDVMALLDRQAELLEHALSTAAASSAAYRGAVANRWLDADCGAEWRWILICLSPVSISRASSFTGGVAGCATASLCSMWDRPDSRCLPTPRRGPRLLAAGRVARVEESLGACVCTKSYCRRYTSQVYAQARQP